MRDKERERRGGERDDCFVMLSLLEIKSVAHVQILNEVICISHSTDTPYSISCISGSRVAQTAFQLWYGNQSRKRKFKLRLKLPARTEVLVNKHV